jgi:SAM-dependent methyltransferase
MNPELNFLNRLKSDVNDVYNRFPLETLSLVQLGLYKIPDFSIIYRLPCCPVDVRRAVWHLLHRSNIDQAWFENFMDYYKVVLNGRPFVSPHDLYFFKNVLRLQFGNAVVDDNCDPLSHLTVWQQPEVLYQLLHLVTREACYNQYSIIKFVRRFIGLKNKSFWEFGCGTAPIMLALTGFHGYSSFRKLFISDIKTISFHYAAWRFRHQRNVIPLLLTEKNGFLAEVPEPVDVIFCITVFEHLPRPLEVIELFNRSLQRNGILIFDYSLGDGAGLDTQVAIRERPLVLDYIKKNFNIEYGSINEEESMGLTIVRKK